MKKMNKLKVLLNVLCLEDVLKDAGLLNEMLVDAGYLVNMDIVAKEKEYLSFLKGRNYDIILADYTLPGFDVHAALKLALELQSEVPFICVSDTISEDKAVELLKLGATDYVLKDRLGRLAFAVRRALEGVANQKEWKKANEALRESEEKYRLLFEESTLGIFAADVETHRILYFNPAICRIFGYLDEEFLRLTIPDLHPKDSMDLVISDFESLMRGNKVMSSTFPCLRKDGTVFYADIAGNPTIINGRKCSVAFFMDVTMRKQAEDAMRESELKFRNYIDYAPHGVFVADEMGNYVDVNTAASSITGYSKDELLSMKLSELIPEESMEFSARHFEKVVRDGFATGEFPFIKKDRSIGYWSVDAVKLSDQRFLGFVVDVTKRKQAEEMLRESKVKYQEIFESTGTATFIGGENAIILMANNECYSITGYTPTEIIGQKWDQYFAPESLQEIMKNHHLRRQNPDLAPKKHEVKLFNKQGEKRDVILNISMISGTKQSIVSILDITERKQAEEMLRESKVKYQAIFENTGTATIIIDEGNTILMANNECYSITGYIPTEIIGQKWNQYFAPESLQKMLKNHQLIRQNPDFAQKKYEVKLINKQGEIRDVILNIGMIPGTKQSIVSVIDITERKRAEQAILQSEENFRRSISESTLGIRIVSVDGKTIYANKAFLDIYEFNSLEEFTNTPAINRYTPESYALHQERKEKRKNGHDVLDYEISIVRKNAEIRHVKVLRKDVMWNGIKNYQVINQDITEQKKQTIDLIEAKEHAEESNKLKSAFLANMSHEIRTPMNGILGFSELLKEPGLTGDQQQEYIRIIEKSGARMLNIINDIVDISKIEAGLINVNITETYINENIESIYLFFKPQVEGKGMQLLFKNTLPEKEAIIRTDNEKVYSILTNLVKNAIKYSKEGAIEFGYIKKDETLEFYVKDTGIGIPKDRQSAIFERFIQADISDKKAFQGAGLGLSISKAYVEMLGGKIWVESEEGIGSTFYFTLPYNAETEEKKVVPAQNEKNQIKDLKILIAEDDETSEMLISITIKEFSKKVLKARTGSEAIEICRTNPDLDLILMDIQMPDLNGYEATRQIRQFNKDVVIIAQTAFGLSGDRKKAIEAGCNDYMAKPINKDELLSLIQKYFEK